MIDPTGPKPGRNRHPDSKEPHFEQDDSRTEQPMYANEPEEPETGEASSRNPGAGSGGWDLPAAARPGQSWPGRQGGTADASGREGQGNQGGQVGQGSAGRQWSGSRGPDAHGAESRPDSRSTGGVGTGAPAGQGGSWQGGAAQGQPGSAPGDRQRGQWPDDDGPAPGGASGQQGQAAEVSAAVTAELAGLKAALEAAEAKAKEAEEQYLRALAEMENVRRRAQDDVSKAHKFAIESFAEGMLPVRDSLEMALTVEVPSVESLREGVEATLRQLTQAFERNRLMLIDPLHQKFDPHLHQAIAMVPSKDVAPNHVVSVLQKGYMINDRILRPALVTVSQSA
jgi:molecular chaperone GrpE